jgi:hypothetical protein
MEEKMENNFGFKELGILANNTLGIKGEDEEDDEIIEEDKNSRKYKTKILAVK